MKIIVYDIEQRKLFSFIKKKKHYLNTFPNRNSVIGCHDNRYLKQNSMIELDYWYHHENRICICPRNCFALLWLVETLPNYYYPFALFYYLIIDFNIVIDKILSMKIVEYSLKIQDLCYQIDLLLRNHWLLISSY